ncbi:Uu.00g072270.m01.CDS01 [Anthostomella pinea]|uniref:Uu.00g072270.m01.CDS01 n=1 Tax=Anthostomella pinea TaxID=933095 RepID=A0AAI8VV22_9PEZI|nr:Uu.00g072270.m01.CDS01 [Anthostomella pinea]
MDEEASLSESSSSEELTPSPDRTFVSPRSHDDSPTSSTIELTPRAAEPPADSQVDGQVVINARAYQLEMFEESLKQNIIVTSICIFATYTDVEEIVWFLAPTVALCEQQLRVLQSQIPAAQMKSLSGKDGVDTWSETRIWDDYLKNVHIVVSTYQILLDAVSHAFVRLDQLSLIVFDEAHNCTGKSPGSKIMEHYRINQAAGLPCPWILGLTASPIMRSRLEAIEQIERTLDAVCKSPNIHRAQLMSAVKRPTMSCISYTFPETDPLTNSMKSLIGVLHSLDIFKDPTILRLKTRNDERSQVALETHLMRRDTYVSKQMQSLCRKSVEIRKELGSWAADYFINIAVNQFLHSVSQNDLWFDTWQTEEKQYLAQYLKKVERISPQPLEEHISDMSSKLTALIQKLSSATKDTVGIIFVRETVTVAILTQMLSGLQTIRSRFRIGSMVGTSNYGARKRDLGELNRDNSFLDLEDFRAGRLNLLIATSVLEEGIDVPACNLVICFDKPANLKSFIQRRGRARMQDSRLVLLLEGASTQQDEWIALENEMKKRYEDDMRQVQKLAEIEESDSSPDIRPLYIPQTNARLDFDQAKSHLEHFCNVVASRRYDSQPYYRIQHMAASEDGLRQIRATVVLPGFLPPTLRRIDSSGVWHSEKNACKDAAFQAYKRLHEEGFVNDNLMPLNREIMEGIEPRNSKEEVNGLWDPWQPIAHAWGKPKELIQRPLLLKDKEQRVICEYYATLPCHFPKPPPFNVFWDATETWTVEFREAIVVSEEDLKADQSTALLDLAYRHRRRPLKDVQHVLHIESSDQIPYQQLVGQHSIEKDLLGTNALVRNRGAPFLFNAWMPSKPLDSALHVSSMVRDEPADVPWLHLKKWPRREDFLHPVHSNPSTATVSKRRHVLWPAHHCRLDGVGVSKVRFGALIPSIVHMIEINLIAHELCNTVLRDVGFSDISLVVTALSSRAASESTDYERLEFLGDSILKSLATACVTAEYPDDPEGYLSAKKDRIVSNGRLCESCKDTGLDKFILTKAFTGAKWGPRYVEDIVQIGSNATNKRMMSTKTLADVVESLIGAAFVDGGMPKALACLRIFIPDVNWHSLNDACIILYNQKQMSSQLPSILSPLEELLGYKFRNKALLLEAVTHFSFDLSTSTDFSMERLEFLGDAILDSIAVASLWSHEREFSNREMHLLRTAAVNADILGFLVMEWTITQEATTITEDRTTITSQTKLPLWKFMRHTRPEVATIQRDAEERHKAEREAVLHALKHGIEYPWAQLAHLHIPKFFSDMFESLLGAVWVDSGSMETCTEMVNRAGILPCLQRFLRDGVDVVHPKNKLGELAARGRKKVRYEVDVRDSDGAAKELCCKVFVGEELVVEVGAGVTPEEVVTKAADEAYKLLRASGAASDEVMME